MRPDTINTRILAAASLLEEPFTAEQLIVRCWEYDPPTFALAGYPQYPDAHKVLCCLCGRKGLVARGLLERVGPKLYRCVAALEQGTPGKVGRRSAELQRLLATEAMQKWLEGRKTELAFVDALDFWSLAQDSPASAIDNRLDDLTTWLKQLLSSRVDLLLPDGMVVTPEQVKMLADLHQTLERRYQRHLTLLRVRTGKAVMA